jgi:hypothetical protein
MRLQGLMGLMGLMARRRHHNNESLNQLGTCVRPSTAVQPVEIVNKNARCALTPQLLPCTARGVHARPDFER